MSDVLWYPSGSFKSNLTLHKIDVVLYHYLPAYFLDFLARMSGNPAMLVRLTGESRDKIISFTLSVLLLLLLGSPLR